MAIIGPRPALWNQYDLIAERDKHGANDVPVGLTGWAQINGRDELEINVKAKLDGEYVKRMSFLSTAIVFWALSFRYFVGMELSRVEQVRCSPGEMKKKKEKEGKK